MSEAKSNAQIKEPTAMMLSTIGADGRLNARVVLCKSWTDLHFTFFTNYNSRKGRELDANPKAAAVFYWDAMARQITISGKVHKATREVSEKYWNSRPRDSQLSQYISKQSEACAGREALEQARLKADQEFVGKSIPCPAHWGGYVLEPERVEFWIGRTGRLHDRHEFENRGGRWTYRRLYP
jgi:pyridoxamine 5'-phosphate oxidase